jgi:hypothetical protein
MVRPPPNRSFLTHFDISRPPFVVVHNYQINIHCCPAATTGRPWPAYTQ